MDFIRGAAMSPGGKPIISLPSTAADGTLTRIVPTFKARRGRRHDSGPRALGSHRARRGQLVRKIAAGARRRADLDRASGFSPRAATSRSPRYVTVALPGLEP